MPCYDGRSDYEERIREEIKMELKFHEIRECEIVIKNILKILSEVTKERDEMGNLLCKIGKDNDGPHSMGRFLCDEFWSWWEEHKKRDAMGAL